MGIGDTVSRQATLTCYKPGWKVVNDTEYYYRNMVFLALLTVLNEAAL